MEQPEKEGSTGEEVAVTSRPDRQRTLTEKGFQWQLEQKEQRFRSLVSKWRRHAVKIECLLSESASVGEVKADRDTLLVLMTEVSKAYDELDSLLGTVNKTGSRYSQPATAISSLENLSKDLSHQISLNRLPLPEPEVFSGDPLKYPGWKSAIDLLLEKKGISPSEKLFYLKRYISGPPKDALEGYLLVPTATTYSEARKLLDKRYGNNLVIADAFRSKLEQWPNIQPNDGIGLRKFADFLMQCESAMHLVKGSLSFLDDSWLPNWLVTRWGRFLSDWGESKGSPPFTQFRQFICKEAEIACNPLITSSKAKRTGTTKGTSNFVTNAVGHSTKDSKIKCLLCKGEHKLDVCKQFLAKPIKDRKDFVKSQNLCFGCLRHGHISKFCRNRLTCNVCSRLHPMSLHGDVSQSDRVKNSNRKTIGIQTEPLSTSVSNMSGSVTMTMSSLIMPVYFT
ncbi:hypothetical protein HOLleu_42745 [Holothuria leucospilota]|uniref:CCHC-type domain-containing protein n=1 Tax=Holothuria leucospilota TaxID=206669 RepID=A0A9Q0YHS6_HOLLE|nr:hypothetical protein HOLleu_42745 [Holothuria leucospilota]